MIELIQRLTETYGPSGSEGAIRARILEEIGGLAGEISVDPMGSIIAWRRPPGAPAEARRIMLAAHMDEIGVMVTHIDEDGYLRFTSIGGVQPLNCVGGRVRFADGTLGTIHVEHRESASSPPAIEHLFIDVSQGGKGKGEPPRVGDAACFERVFEQRGRRLIAKSLDDRIGCAILIEVMRRLESTAHEVAFVFSVQEEVGLRGAGTAAYAVDPHFGIAVDVTRSGDTPKAPPMAVRLGDGPAIKIKDARFLADPDVIALLEHAAKRAGVKPQREVLQGGTTDATAMQLTRAGVKAGCLSIPCRYVHSPSETVDLDDVEGAVALLVNLLQNDVSNGAQ